MFGKRKLRNKISKLETELNEMHVSRSQLLEECDRTRDERDRAIDEFNKLSDAYYRMKKTFPLNLDDVVYVLELKNDKGRYAKKNPSFEHSSINEVVVTKMNYFNLIDKIENLEAFSSHESAEVYLKKKCGTDE